MQLEVQKKKKNKESTNWNSISRMGLGLERCSSSEVRLWMKKCSQQRLSWPAPEPFSPLLHLYRVLAISLNLLLSLLLYVYLLLFIYLFLFTFDLVCLVDWQNFNQSLVEILRWQWRFLHEFVGARCAAPFEMLFCSFLLVLSLR